MSKGRKDSHKFLSNKFIHLLVVTMSLLSWYLNPDLVMCLLLNTIKSDREAMESSVKDFQTTHVPYTILNITLFLLPYQEQDSINTGLFSLYGVYLLILRFVLLSP